MTHSDTTHSARLARLISAGEGATVTVTEDALAVAGSALEGVKAGDVFVNDGSGDTIPWFFDSRRNAGVFAAYVAAATLANAGLDVDARTPAELDQEKLLAGVTDALIDTVGRPIPHRAEKIVDLVVETLGLERVPRLADALVIRATEHGAKRVFIRENGNESNGWITDTGAQWSDSILLSVVSDIEILATA